MKTLSAALKTHMALETTTLCTCWKLVLTNTDEFFFTSLDVDLTIDGDTYEAGSGYQPTEIDQGGGLSVDNLEVKSFLSSSRVAESDILAGIYDYAEIDIFVVNYKDLTMGKMYLAQGWVLGEITVQDNQFQCEVRGKAQKLSQQLVELYSPECRAVLGDTRCKITLNPSDWVATTVYAVDAICKATSYDGRRYVCTTAGTSGAVEPVWNTVIGNTSADGTVVWTCYDAFTKQGTVTGVTSKTVFTDSSRTETSDLFMYGLLTWTSGNNNGLTMEVKSFTHATDIFTLFLPMSYVIITGDTYTVTYGCDKKKDTCKNVFGNLINMRAEIFLPGVDKLLEQNIPS